MRAIGVVLTICALLSAAGCSSVKKSMGGTSQAPSMPVPRLSASASAIRITTNVHQVAAAKAPAPAPAPAKEAKPAPVPVPAPGSMDTVGRETTTAYKLRPGDPVIIFLRGIQPKDDELQDIIDEAGNLNMPYIGAVHAAGRTTSQLENDIQKTYLDKEIYKSITVNVVLPSQSFFVRGEVRIPGRFPLLTGTTVLQAISSAGGYTDYADPRGANVIRGERVIKLNARELERHPEHDVAIEPGDVIVIPRSMF